MDRYLIESPHDLENCAQVLQQIQAMGYLYNFDWGCKAGVHVGCASIEAESEPRPGWPYHRSSCVKRTSSN